MCLEVSNEHLPDLMDTKNCNGKRILCISHSLLEHPSLQEKPYAYCTMLHFPPQPLYSYLTPEGKLWCFPYAMNKPALWSTPLHSYLKFLACVGKEQQCEILSLKNWKVIVTASQKISPKKSCFQTHFIFAENLIARWCLKFALKCWGPNMHLRTRSSYTVTPNQMELENIQGLCICPDIYPSPLDSYMGSIAAVWHHLPSPWLLIIARHCLIKAPFWGPINRRSGQCAWPFSRIRAHWGYPESLLKNRSCEES